MPEQAKPSAGAMRAAFALMRNASQGRKWSDLDLVAQPITHEVANTIDRETGVAELLDAAKQVNGFLNLWYASSRPGFSLPQEISYRFEQAIAKAERGA